MLGCTMKSFRLGLIATAFLGLATAATASCGYYHVVQPGETLADVAEQGLGSVFRFETIRKVNAPFLRESDFALEAGRLIDLPCPGTQSDVASLATTVEPKGLWNLMLHVRGMQILDIRSLKTLAGGVLPHTIAIPFEFWQAPNDSSTAGAAQHMANVIGGAGLRLDQPIAILYGNDTAMGSGEALFVSWLLKSAGAEQTAILRGGYDAWVNADLPITVNTARVAPYKAKISLSADWRRGSSTN